MATESLPPLGFIKLISEFIFVFVFFLQHYNFVDWARPGQVYRRRGGESVARLAA
jgi:hypothetical protein